MARVGYLLELILGATPGLGEVITETVAGLRVEGQAGGWGRCGGLEDPNGCVKGLGRDAHRLAPTQLHLEAHDRLTCTRSSNTQHSVFGHSDLFSKGTHSHTIHNTLTVFSGFKLHAASVFS